MRTRRIAIGCRRTGPASTVAVAPSGSAGTPDPVSAEFLPVDLAWPPHIEPMPSRLPGVARAGGGHLIPTPAPPPPDERDLTLADLTTGRRDLTWNDNPGWPAQIDWTTIARTARGHSPRHARRRRADLAHRAFTWTGAGFLTAVLLTVLIATVGDLLS
jgi:hypothetical protein